MGTRDLKWKLRKTWLHHSSCLSGGGDCLLEFEIKEIATLIDKKIFTFISGKHSQHNARKCADRLTQKGNSERHWHPSRLGRYYFDRVVREEV